MTSSRARWIAAALLAACATTACKSASPSKSQAPTPAPNPANGFGEQGDQAAVARARADSARYPYTAADIQFMTGMISHHAQAIVMAGWAPTHGASGSLLVLCKRIINAQQDEILTMQQWLRDRNQPVPEAKAVPMKMMMNGHEQEMLMPGMLSEAQMKQLDAARGTEFDRLFLTFMIQHHRGAISMVKDLFDTYGAAQDELTFKLASDINVDQTTEIARMQRMLFAVSLESSSQ
jgi:uncharacterized protein (DUF305 family)